MKTQSISLQKISHHIQLYIICRRAELELNEIEVSLVIQRTQRHYDIPSVGHYLKQTVEA